MKILLNKNDLNKAINNVPNLGFVPTMGSLHDGHISLIKKSKKKSTKTIVSIFVNPTQFNSIRDFKNYPRNNKRDLNILKKLKVNFVFIPNQKDIYKFKRRKKIKLDKKDKILCAKYRKGHFEGVIDVMDRLIGLIKPKNIFMGLKDFQQLFLVRKFIKRKYKSRVIGCETIRNNNKLALSSRNFLLKKKQIIIAEKLSQNLIYFKKNLFSNKNINEVIDKKKNKLEKFFKIKIEYLELRNIKNLSKTKKNMNSKLFIAYYMGKIRLIDNF